MEILFIQLSDDAYISVSKNCHVIYIYISCGSVVGHCVTSAKVVGSIPREHILTKKMYNLKPAV